MTPQKIAHQKNIVMIGGGHNALVCSGYLAKAGHRVTVLEKNNFLGGATSTDETTFPGFKISTASYLNSLMLTQVVDDLELRRFGYEVLPRNPSSCTPLPDGKGVLFLGSDMEFNKREIAKFSERDAEAYPKYEEALGGVAEWVAGLMTMTPPNLHPKTYLPKTWRDWKNLGKFLWHARKLFPKNIFVLARLYQMNDDPVGYLDSWFESDVLKATLLTDAMIGATDFSCYVLLHHVMGEAGGARGVWGYQRGGMGGIAKALTLACTELGVEFVLGAHAHRIAIIGGKQVSGVWAKLQDGGRRMPSKKFFEADIVVSAIDPTHTFRDLLSIVESVHDVREKIVARDTHSASMKINMTLKKLPSFIAMPGNTAGPQHQGTVHISPDVAYILKAHEMCKEGKYHFASPVLEITFPSVVDDTLAPKGSHVMNIFVQFYPYEADYAGRGSLHSGNLFCTDVVMPVLRKYFSDIDDCIIGVQALTPKGLEEKFGMVGGNIFHGGMGLDALFWKRPILGMADYRTPIMGLYLSGAATHPGGGATGACGYNCAREVLYDIES